MNGPSCRQLDDYLDGTLTDGALAAFEAHIDQCDECRGSVVQHREMVRLLQRGVDQFEAVPPLWIDRTKRAMRRHDHRRRVRLVAGLTTAAVLLIGVGIRYAGNGLRSMKTTPSWSRTGTTTSRHERRLRRSRGCG